MRIVHRMEGRSSVERLVSLDGSGREIVRTPRRSARLPARSPRRAGRAAHRRWLAAEGAADAGRRSSMPSTCSRHAAARELLGRDVRVIEIRPQRRLSLRLPALAGREDGDAAALGSRRRGGPADRADPVHAARDARPTSRRRTSSPRSTRPVSSGCARRGKLADCRSCRPTGWRPLKVPPGSAWSASRLQSLPGSSDAGAAPDFLRRLRAVSVFIEPGVAHCAGARRSLEHGLRERVHYDACGATSITAVGEVPPTTVRDIATSLAPASDVGATRTTGPIGRV